MAWTAQPGSTGGETRRSLMVLHPVPERLDLKVSAQPNLLKPLLQGGGDASCGFSSPLQRNRDQRQRSPDASHLVTFPKEFL